MINYIDNHIISFVDEWSNTILPQLNNAVFHDATNVFSKTMKSKMIINSIKDGKKIYILGFYGGRGMINKWLVDENGKMIRDKGRGLVAVNSSVVTMSTIDINVPFITSDEVLSVNYPKDRPYNLERKIVVNAMRKFGYDPNEDIIFIFFEDIKLIEFTIERFLNEMKHIMTNEYLRAKGIIAVKDPKWIKYHASDEVTKYTNTFFFNGVILRYTERETRKNI